jgi:hypothetical protein
VGGLECRTGAEGDAWHYRIIIGGGVKKVNVGATCARDHEVLRTLNQRDFALWFTRLSMDQLIVRIDNFG